MKRRKKDTMSQISLSVTDRQQEEIARISKIRDMSKADAYRMMIDLGLDLHRDLEKVGIIPLMDFALYVKMAIHEKSRSNGSPKQMQII